MGTNVGELKKIHDLDLDDYGDDATLARIRADLVSCDDTIRSIAANPAFEGETQFAVNRALAQLQAEVRKWYVAVGTIKAERTTARDSMRVAKPKYDELPEYTGDNMNGAALAIEDKRDKQAGEALAPMDATLTASAQALRRIDLSRPSFDPNRQVDQTPLDELPASTSAAAGGGGGVGSHGVGSGAGSHAVGGAGSSGAGMQGYGASAAILPTTPGPTTGAFGAAAAVSGARILSNARTYPITANSGWQATQVDRLTGNANSVGGSQGTAYASGRYTVKDGRLVPLPSPNESGTGGTNKVGVVAGTAGTAAAAAAAIVAARGLSGTSAAVAGGLNAAGTAGSTAAMGVNGSTGIPTAAGGSAAPAAGATGAQSAAGRPVMGAPAAAARGAGQARNRRRPDGIYDIPLLEEPTEQEHIGDPGIAGQAGSRDTMPSPQWPQESDTW
ncbi:hypothetical protein [Actinomyces sp.]|uniref:hypothetical protein n=1 Tax=Actinomyces sp. TaxID=29317 RepID=UPI0026DA7181|nr:hypothetical protein [Actinomyces sp.]MDO4900756.1 hypothetical protein [Actinomyces sp.]